MVSPNAYRYVLTGLGAMSHRSGSRGSASAGCRSRERSSSRGALLSTWSVATVGFGAALLSRGGVREHFAGRILPPELMTDEYLWATPQFGVPAVKRPPKEPSAVMTPRCSPPGPHRRMRSPACRSPRKSMRSVATVAPAGRRADRACDASSSVAGRARRSGRRRAISIGCSCATTPIATHRCNQLRRRAPGACGSGLQGNGSAGIRVTSRAQMAQRADFDFSPGVPLMPQRQPRCERCHARPRWDHAHRRSRSAVVRAAPRSPSPRRTVAKCSQRHLHARCLGARRDAGSRTPAAPRFGWMVASGRASCRSMARGGAT